MFEKKDMIKALKSAKKIIPICIPSYNRWNLNESTTISKIIDKCDQTIKDNTYIFVRREQLAQYKQTYPTYNIVPMDNIKGIADTRNFMCDYAYGYLKQKYYIDMDDDMTSLNFIYYDEEENKTKVSSQKETNYSQVLKLLCELTYIAFNKTKAIYGSVRKRRFANRYENSQIALITNKGITPRGLTINNAEIFKQKNYKRDEIFNLTGDDIGFVAQLSQNKEDFFYISCLAIDFQDETKNSVIRNDDNRRALAKYELQCLLKYPMGKHYLKITHKYEDGFYKFSDIDYTKYRKLYNKKSISIPLEVIYDN